MNYPDYLTLADIQLLEEHKEHKNKIQHAISDFERVLLLIKTFDYSYLQSTNLVALKNGQHKWMVIALKIRELEPAERAFFKDVDHATPPDLSHPLYNQPWMNAATAEYNSTRLLSHLKAGLNDEQYQELKSALTRLERLTYKCSLKKMANRALVATHTSSGKDVMFALLRNYSKEQGDGRFMPRTVTPEVSEQILALTKSNSLGRSDKDLLLSEKYETVLRERRDTFIPEIYRLRVYTLRKAIDLLDVVDVSFSIAVADSEGATTAKYSHLLLPFFKEAEND